MLCTQGYGRLNTRLAGPAARPHAWSRGSLPRLTDSLLHADFREFA